MTAFCTKAIAALRSAWADPCGGQRGYYGLGIAARSRVRTLVQRERDRKSA
jgi:hypothetical protein